jgi:quinol monooxygenase YgiN
VESLLAFLSGVQSRSIQAGCLSISLLQDQDDPTRVFEIEVWKTADDHKRFVQSATASGAFAPFDKLLAAPIEGHYLNTVKHSEA